MATSSASLFTQVGASFRAGLSLTIADFLRTDPAVVVQNLRRSMLQIGIHPHRKEADSWKTSVPALQALLNDDRVRAGIILLEAVIPENRGRIDCVILGSTQHGESNVVALELKAWSDAKKAPYPSNMLIPLNSRSVASDPRVHPSIQASGYKSQLHDLLVACRAGSGISIFAAAFLYNTNTCAREPFTNSHHADAIRLAPIFGATEVADFRVWLSKLVPNAPSDGFLNMLAYSKIAASPSLVERFASELSNLSAYNMSYDQIEMFHRIVNSYDSSMSRVIIVRGGPGVGKSVLALQLLREFNQNGVSASYAARSRAIIDGYRDRFPGSSNLFSKFGKLRRANTCVLIVDEAHRLSNRKQVEELIDSAHLVVFLIDDHQIILPSDQVDSRAIIKSALELGRSTRVLELIGDKRSGSETYVRWIDSGLRIGPMPDHRIDSSYHFEIVDSPYDLDSKLMACGGTSRLVAGICWAWSNPEPSGELVNDVRLADSGFARPWSPNPNLVKDASMKRIASCWATDPEARHYIGNVYTAQSFEFDNVGVIFGSDLVIRNGIWKLALDRHSRSDRLFFTAGIASIGHEKVRMCLKNVYRVLLTRGRKGCFVFFEDSETRTYFEDHLSKNRRIA